MKKTIKLLALLFALMFSLSCLIACNEKDDDEPRIIPASDPATAKSELQDNDYTVSLVELDEATEAGEIAMLTAYHEDGPYIVIVWYQDSKSAKKGYRELKDELSTLREELEASKNDLDSDTYEQTKEELDRLVIGATRDMVWMASSKDAVKAAKQFS